jgi:hypothetical protein
MSRVIRRQTRGFTLIEAALTTVIVGTGVLAIVAAQQAYHEKNDWARRTGTGILLANELRELTMALPMYDPFTGDTHVGAEDDEADVSDFDDLDDFAGVVDGLGFGAGVVFGPPINALRDEVDNLDGWSQKIEVVNVDSNDITASSRPLGTTDLMRVNVTVSYQAPNAEAAATISKLSWLISR